MTTATPMRSGSIPAHDPTPADLERLADVPARGRELDR